VERNEAMKKIREEADFIHAPKFSNSLQKFLAKNENLLENNAIGRLLLLSPEEVEAIYQESVVKLREEMTDEDNEDSR
jgi:hypothetical protein